MQKTLEGTGLRCARPGGRSLHSLVRIGTQHGCYLEVLPNVVKLISSKTGSCSPALFTTCERKKGI